MEHATSAPLLERVTALIASLGIVLRPGGLVPGLLVSPRAVIWSRYFYADDGPAGQPPPHEAVAQLIWNPAGHLHLVIEETKNATGFRNGLLTREPDHRARYETLVVLVPGQSSCFIAKSNDSARRLLPGLSQAEHDELAYGGVVPSVEPGEGLSDDEALVRLEACLRFFRLHRRRHEARMAVRRWFGSHSSKSFWARALPSGEPRTGTAAFDCTIAEAVPKAEVGVEYRCNSDGDTLFFVRFTHDPDAEPSWRCAYANALSEGVAPPVPAPADEHDTESVLAVMEDCHAYHQSLPVHEP